MADCQPDQRIDTVANIVRANMRKVLPEPGDEPGGGELNHRRRGRQQREHTRRIRMVLGPGRDERRLKQGAGGSFVQSEAHCGSDGIGRRVAMHVKHFGDAYQESFRLLDQ